MDDREKQWKENPQKITELAVVQVDFLAQEPLPGGAGRETLVAGVAQAG